MLAAKVRAGFEATSADLGVAHVGEVITEIESRVNASGIRRVRYDRGWLSQKTADGRAILEAYDPLPEGWTTQTSRSTGRMYYVNHSTGQSTFDRNDPMIPKVVAPAAPAPVSHQRIVEPSSWRGDSQLSVQADDTRNLSTSPAIVRTLETCS